MDYEELIELLREYAGCCTRGISRAAIVDYFEQAASALETLLAERDAEMEDLRGDCRYCKHNAYWHNMGSCNTCKYEDASTFLPEDTAAHTNDNWEWHEPIKKDPPFTDYKIGGQEFWDSFFKANWGRKEGEYEPIGRYILREDDGKYTGMDNSHGCAWVETFDTLEECLQWLSGKEAGSHLDG